MEDNKCSEVKVLGILGCQVHNEPYQIIEISTKTPGANRRFIFICPIKGCGLGIKVNSLSCRDIKISSIEGS